MNEELKKTMHDRGICVIIPTYNNRQTVSKVAMDALQYCADVIVVDDGSTDGTGDNLRLMTEVDVVTHNTNKGKGAALKTGFRHAIKRGFAYAITLDADGQHYAADIPKFVRENQAHPGAIIMGERKLEGVKRSKGSSFANKFSNFWFCVQTGRHLHDTQTGYRLYPLRHLWGLGLLTSRYEAELELIVWAAWHGVEIHTAEIDVFYPPKEERISHFRPAADFARISVFNTIMTALAVVYAWPLKILRWLMVWLRTLYALLFFLFFALIVFAPWVAWTLHVGKMTEEKRCRLRRGIYHFARLVTIHHGIPGTKFRAICPPAMNWDEPRIVVCNHQSQLDLMALLVFTPKIVFMTNDWVYHNPFFGKLIRTAEYLPATEGIETLMPRLQSLVDRGYSIAIFPEGTRSRDCQVHRFHKGAFHIAQMLRLDILPLCLYGTGKVLRKGSYHLNRGKICIEAGEPITREQLDEMGDVRKQTSILHKQYVEWYQDLSNRIEQYV